MMKCLDLTSHEECFKEGRTFIAEENMLQSGEEEKYSVQFSSSVMSDSLPGLPVHHREVLATFKLFSFKKNS